VLGGILYTSDILIASEILSEHISYLKKVLQRLQQAGLRVKPSKCTIAEHQVEYLDFVLSARGVNPTEKDIEAIKLFPRPNTVKEIKQFLELANFYWRHVKNMGMISKPLTALTRKDKQSGQPLQFEWNEQCEEAFWSIK